MSWKEEEEEEKQQQQEQQQHDNTRHNPLLDLRLAVATGKIRESLNSFGPNKAAGPSGSEKSVRVDIQIHS